MARRKRPPASSEGGIDIFQNARLGEAMARATAPVPVDDEPNAKPSGEPEPSAGRPPQKRTGEMEAAAERAPEASQTQRAPRARPKTATTTKVAPEPILAPEPNVPLKFRVPQGLKTDFMTFKAELSAALGGVSLDDSNIARPLLEEFLVEYRTRILEAARTFEGPLVRPRNGDAVGMAEFDHSIGELFKQARKRRNTTKSK